MKKTITHIISLWILAMLLSACASTGSAATNASPSRAQGTPQPFNLANQSLESKLAIGILKMEGTNLAVTAEQAKTLLPLWKALKSLETSATTSQEEINAVYRQIEEALTQDQLQYIKDLQMTSEDFQNLMQSLGIQGTNFAGGGNFQNLSESERATRIAQFQAQRSAQGEPGAPGGEFGGGPGFAPPGGNTGTTRSTPNPTQAAIRRSIGLNRMFIDPLIQILEKRATE